MPLRTFPALLCLLVLSGASATARERSPAEREILSDLAYTLGQAHGIRTRCEGEGDQVWRARMLRMIELEQPEEGFRNQLFESFNTGFLGAQASHPRCSDSTRAEAARVAARGRDLSSSLAAR